jgi:hypothetical protein
LRAALVVALVAAVGWAARFTYGRRLGIDFYQYWSVGAAMRLSGGSLAPPYVDLDGYVAIIDRYAAASGDARLAEVNAALHHSNAHGLELNNSPLLYAAFAGMPMDYSDAWALFLALRVALLLGALYLLAPPGDDGRLTLLLAIPIVALYRPLGSDARVGNIAVVQLFAVAALARAARGSIPWTGRWAAVRSGVVLTGAAFLVLTKPNAAPIAVVLAHSVAFRDGPRAFLRGCALALVPALALALLPCAWFGSWSVWTDWFRFLDPFGKLAEWPIADGNFCSAVLLGRALGIPVHAASAATAFLLAASAAAAAGLRPGAADRIRTVLRDPLLGASLAICALLATSPLAWLHYHVLALAPALRLLTAPAADRTDRILGGAGLLLASGTIGLLGFDVETAVAWTVALSWLPLWAGTLRAAARTARADLPAAAAVGTPILAAP